MFWLISSLDVASSYQAEFLSLALHKHDQPLSGLQSYTLSYLGINTACHHLGLQTRLDNETISTLILEAVQEQMLVCA